MRDDIRLKKQQRIEQAAYDLLEEHGYEGISMLKIAKRAKSSNETLYRWYGDKKGLFRSLVQNNARHVKEFLELDADENRPALETLEVLGPRLLSLLVGDRAIALNRAAAGDPSGEVGQALALSGRDTVLPLIEDVFVRLCEKTAHPVSEAVKLAEVYLRLLVGDLQIRRVTGAISKPSKAVIAKRAEEAKILILQMVNQ
ncbi:Transcriptional regulator, AcrR family [hydrothermal vent metagenome]|uniref:Transcriptional regulator, AcrR family n=1 Tax=hydrothermal vent metagenome TaxID=652676 RepID=A0A3B1AS86_9ZZZZ